MTASPDPLLRIDNLSKSFGDHQVLKDISLEVRHGEVISVIGASGSGKSTFLRCLNVLERPDQGRLSFENFHFDFRAASVRQPTEAELKALRARIGMVFQSYNLWPHMTVLENVIEAPIRVRRTPRAEAVERAETLLARIGLAEKRDAYPSRLSGGQQQRVAIVRALAMQPRLMLFDEVTSALDPELVGEVLAADGAAGGRGHDHAAGHPRDGLCPRRHPPGRSSSTAAASPRTVRRANCSAGRAASGFANSSSRILHETYAVSPDSEE